MKRKIQRALSALVYSLLLFLCAAMLFSSASAESAVDLANTENHDGFLGFCTLPDGGLVLAGYTEIPDEQGPDKGRIICLDPDRTVRWTYTDTDAFSYGTVVLTKDGTIAAYYFDGVKFFTPEGQLLEKKIPLIYTDGNIYDITPFGVLSARRISDPQAEDVGLTGWDGSSLFRIHEPESMWVGSAPIEDGDALVLYGQAAGAPAEAPAKIMKVDLQGNTVWETVLPFLSDSRDGTGLQSVIRTGDGGYLGVLWERTAASETGDMEGKYALVRFGAGGELLWMRRTDTAVWQVAEYDGKFAAYGRSPDPGSGRTAMRYLWLDAGGNELGTTELQIADGDFPQYAKDGGLSMTVEKLVPMSDGLWQVLCFWDTDEPEEEDPAWIQQDNLLVRVPEL